MRLNRQRLLSLAVIAVFAIVAIFAFGGTHSGLTAFAQATPTPTPAAAEFDQKAALAKLREQIKGKEKDPASTVFKNIQIPMLKDRPAGQLLAVMEFGYARSLGVTCTHCHVADKWESEEKPQKQIARDMAAMTAKITLEMLKGIKGLKSESPTVNCTTCHRGEVKPALNIAPAK